MLEQRLKPLPSIQQQSVGCNSAGTFLKMDHSQIFKLIFKHDLRLHDLGNNADIGGVKKTDFTLSDFTKPDPTYSEIHFAGTNLETEQFALSILAAFPNILNAILEGICSVPHFRNGAGVTQQHEAVMQMDLNEYLILPSSAETASNFYTIGKDAADIKRLLEEENLILIKIPAPDGFDLKLFSRHNIYRYLFEPLKKLVPEHFRFFSINGHKFRAERFFYFETWSLHRLPHGFEEVHPYTNV